MAMTLEKLPLPRELATAVVNKAKDTSTIAALSPSSPMIFTDKDFLMFNGKSEAEVVAEGQSKGSYEQDTTTVSAKRFKVQTTTRVTNELQWADEDNRTQIIEAIQLDQAAAIGRALDYVIYHAVNPKDGEPLTGYDALTAGAVQVPAGDDEIANVDALADALNQTYDVNGVALSRTWASRLRKVRVPSTGMRFYPEIPLNLQAGSLDGITAATSGTVNGTKAKTPTGVLALMGDFSLIKWGMVRDMFATVIPYGDPDHAGTDLQNVNMVAYRTEAVFAYAVLDPKGFAVLKTPAGEGA
ncbi:phage major capsid protein [Bifidobacterium reuteri]|uniref:Phage major capsid protein n=3 Tax=Bifidobacterium TaxID=1678 RepID=A0A5N5RCE5_9BIFI|nr:MULTISPECIES: phage major capsid protein [Bifidobacterium]KAA8824890.1 phage major capsid protein [Bifidobacterium reuteri]KAB5604152.1 phage major capsid protein [Bifidobacterium jacchi]KFI86215.1 phage major head protein [Bifidobacterium reuteri DSM 23975]TPF78357.1 head protein [Bifidobacterium sp. UTCIF-1]TPF81222.1 head protein [Bifidobacterium sp. UTCIF-24]